MGLHPLPGCTARAFRIAGQPAGQKICPQALACGQKELII